jgi:adenylyltransferase/sulfurtransferase
MGALRPDQRERYRRHLSLPQIGVGGQERLLASRVLLLGAGGLGCPAAQYLAAAGVGTLGLVDFDRVDVSNLQRQILYGTADVGRPKVAVARERIAALNPDVKVETFETRLAADNVLDLLAGWDVVVDGTDNFPARYVVSDACVLLGKPNVHGSVLRFEGQVSVFDARRGPCYRCVYPEPPGPGEVPSCAEGGVLGAVPGLVALVQAIQAVQLVTGVGEPLVGRLLQIDALEMTFSEFRVSKDPACPSCGEHPTITAPRDLEGYCAAGAGDDVPEIEAAALRDLLRERGGDLVLVDVREPAEHAESRIEGARLVPLGQLEARLAELAAHREGLVVVHCKSGARSRRACALLQERGFRDVRSLRGGIEAWADLGPSAC